MDLLAFLLFVIAAVVAAVAGVGISHSRVNLWAFSLCLIAAGLAVQAFPGS